MLRKHGADVLTVYDWHGNYGHPDHIAVHRVGVAAGRMVPSVRILEATMNRDAFTQMVLDMRETGVAMETDEGAEAEEFDPNQKRALGNVPQAYSHLGVINNALNLGGL